MFSQSLFYYPCQIYFSLPQRYCLSRLLFEGSANAVLFMIKKKKNLQKMISRFSNWFEFLCISSKKLFKLLDKISVLGISTYLNDYIVFLTFCSTSLTNMSRSLLFVCNVYKVQYFWVDKSVGKKINTSIQHFEPF